MTGTSWKIVGKHMQAHFLSFGDGSQNYRDAVTRIGDQAKQTGWFKSVTAADALQLQNIDPEWYKLHHPFIQQSPKGFGYWIWKPQLIYNALKRLELGEHLVYMDCGGEINRYGYQHYLHMCELATRFGFFCYQIGEPLGRWTKRLTLNLFGVQDENEDILNFGMLESGISIYVKTPKTMLFLDLWRRYCTDDKYSYVIDKADSCVERVEFREHRHDQSIYTLLHLHTGIGFHLNAFDSQHLLWRNSLYHAEMPFLTLRNRQGKSRLIDFKAVRIDRPIAKPRA